MWRRSRQASDRALDARSIVAALFAAAVMAGMVWMAMTGHNFCCDPNDLVGQLRNYLAAGR